MSHSYPHRQYVCLLLCLIGIVCPAVAQTIAIDYDYLNPANSTWHYETGNDTTPHTERKIRVAKENQVKVLFRNFNTDAVQSEVLIRKGPNPDSVLTTSITSLLGMAANFGTSGGLELTKLLAPKLRGGDAANLLYTPLQVDFDKARSLVTAPITELDGAIRERLTEVAKWRNVREQIKTLRYKSTVPKAELQKRCQEVLGRLTASAPALFDNETEARKLLVQFALENAQYLQYALTLLEQKSVGTTAQPATRGDTEPMAFNDFLIQQTIKQHRKIINDELPDQLVALLMETLTHYQALGHNTFTANLRSTVDRNSEAIILQFYDKSTPVSGDKQKVIGSDKFTITQPGQWQVVPGFGLSFIRFSKRLQSYGVVGGKVAVADLDDITPTVAGYVQVFPRNARYVRLGAHIGVGVPLTEVKGVAFQFGPSVAFGRRNAISINVGVFTARATRLGAGLAVGDAYTASSSPPTINRYEWGYHAGISFQFGLRR